MPLTFVQGGDGAWRAEGAKRNYRITLVRAAVETRYRVLYSTDAAAGSGTHAVAGIYNTLHDAQAWCDAAERGELPLSRRQDGTGIQRP